MNKIKLITCTKAAIELGFSTAHIRRMCAEGKIKAEKLGKTWLIGEKELKNIKRQRITKEKVNGNDE